jgi:AraC-like DNA-binding protein
MSSNTFQFLNVEQDSGVTVLNAVMSDFSYGKHAHEELSIGVTTEGIQEFYCNGSMFRSQPGDIILFNPDDVHTGNPGDKDVLKYTMLYLDTERLYPLIECASKKNIIDYRILKNHFRDSNLRSLLLYSTSLISTHLEREHYLYKIAVKLSKILGKYQPIQLRHNKDTALLSVRDYIHDNITEEITIDDLSRVVNISKYHFIRVFREQFGMSPHQYILNYRINRVREALKGGMPITHIAHEYGFFDSSHLNRHFKRTYGLTPRQYQAQVRENTSC